VTAYEIAACFNACFARAQRTLLVGGADEPLYLPGARGGPAKLYFREDFAASALHEAAHWCIAGPRRREQTDFGYAYVAPPRSEQQQVSFFAAELNTQSLESVFAVAADVTFRPSADNLQACTEVFAAQVQRARPVVINWLRTSRDARARRFLASLRRSGGAG